jgi:hypothetical protein
MNNIFSPPVVARVKRLCPRSADQTALSSVGDLNKYIVVNSFYMVLIIFYKAAYVISAAINAVLKGNRTGLHPFPGADFNPYPTNLENRVSS